jgi:hypothetical protein
MTVISESSFDILAIWSREYVPNVAAVTNLQADICAVRHAAHEIGAPAAKRSKDDRLPAPEAGRSSAHQTVTGGAGEPAIRPDTSWSGRLAIRGLARSVRLRTHPRHGTGPWPSSSGSGDRPSPQRRARRQPAGKSRTLDTASADRDPSERCHRVGTRNTCSVYGGFGHLQQCSRLSLSTLGGGGNRTRVLQCITRASPGAACCAFLSPGDHASKTPTGSAAVRCPA